MKQFINVMMTKFKTIGFLRNHSGKDHHQFSLFLILTIAIPAISYSAPPAPPAGLCFQTEDGVMQCVGDSLSFSDNQTGVFPGTNLKFYPGFVIAANENQSPSVTESRWQALFTSNPDRKSSYRPKGVYGGVMRRLNWDRFYSNESIRPKNPKDNTDPAYDWSSLDSIFTINAVKNEGALVLIDVRDIGFGSQFAPTWLSNAPYNGVYLDSGGGAAGAGRYIPGYHRFAGPDIRGLTNVGESPPIVEEFVAFHQAMHDHLVATGNIDKVMGVKLEELFGGDATGATTDFYYGAGLRSKVISQIWGKSQIPVYQLSITGGSTITSILGQYVQSSQLGIGYPDMKLTNTGTPPLNRFSIDGVYQKDNKPLMEATEGNGLRASTYFSSDVPNPWGYSDVTVPQTASQILWALSGPPKGTNKDSALGQSGNDPPGIMPVHLIVLEWDSSSSLSPTVDDWHKAIDTFGPPGTFAFPYFPAGFTP